MTISLTRAFIYLRSQALQKFDLILIHFMEVLKISDTDGTT